MAKIDREQFSGIPPRPSQVSRKDKPVWTRQSQSAGQFNPDEVTVQDMKKALDDPKLGIKVIDVREADEYEIAKVEGVPLLPLSQINERFTELDPNQTYYIHCKAGVRSLKALNFLRLQGFKYLKSVKGGITAWSEEIDRNVPRYQSRRSCERN
jgi:rhodanese-related sulfurtransferase